MSNELLFLAHIGVVVVSVLGALAHSYGALLAVLGVQLILANLFVTKQIVLAGMTTTCSEVFIVSGMYGISLIQAYYGVDQARKAIVYTFSMLLLFVLLSRLHVWYEPVVGNTVADALTQLLDPAPRLMFASMCAYVVSECIHLFFTRLLLGNKLLRRGVVPVMRVSAIFLGQVADTVIFAFVGLYGLVASLGSIIAVSVMVKMVVVVLLAPLLMLARWLVPIRRGES